MLGLRKHERFSTRRGKSQFPRIHSCVFSLSWTCALLSQAVVLASPANPLGSVTHLEELQRIAKVVEEKVPALLGDKCGCEAWAAWD